MIEKLPHELGFLLSCDTCSYFEEFENGNNWDDFVEYSKEKGWRFKLNQYSEWEHYCQDCVEKWKQRNDIKR